MGPRETRMTTNLETSAAAVPRGLLRKMKICIPTLIAEGCDPVFSILHFVVASVNTGDKLNGARRGEKGKPDTCLRARTIYIVWEQHLAGEIFTRRGADDR